MTFEEAKRVSVYDLCIKFGAKRVQASDAKHYALFHAPYREDRHPSLVVDLSANRWRDLAKGYGGDAVDLVCRQYEYMSARDALDFLGGNHMERSVDSSYSYKKMSPLKKENKRTLVHASQIMPLENKVLLDYVASRAISPAIAKRFCLEMHKMSTSGKEYYTLAFPSISGGYELRNSGFKGADGPKDISVIGQGNLFLFFEGVFDFMSNVQIYGYHSDATYVVLNSTAMASRAAEYVTECGRTPEGVQLWLDNDDAGRAASTALLRYFPSAIDMSDTYQGCVDLNEYCVKLL